MFICVSASILLCYTRCSYTASSSASHTHWRTGHERHIGQYIELHVSFYASTRTVLVSEVSCCEEEENEVEEEVQKEKENWMVVVKSCR